MVTSRLYRVERLWRHSGARRGVWKSCHVVTFVPESAGKNALPSNVRELSRGNLIVVIKLLSLAGNCQEGIAVKSPVVRNWSVNISASETAADVSREECTSLARPTVKEYEFACTLVKSLARKTVHLVRRNVRTDALTADVPNSVWNLARLAWLVCRYVRTKSEKGKVRLIFGAAILMSDPTFARCPAKFNVISASRVAFSKV